MTKPLLVLLAWMVGIGAWAQNDPASLSVGYFAPYGIQLGGKLGASFQVGQWPQENEATAERIHKLKIQPQVGYFTYPQVQHNFVLNCEAVYLRTRPGRRFTPLASVGLGYWMARQRQGGSVNLGSGEITYDVENLHYITPTLNIGFEIAPKKVIGYYLKGFAGRKIGLGEPSAGLFGLEAGLTFQLTKKDDTNDTGRVH